MRTFFFTFGSNSPFNKHYVGVVAQDAVGADACMKSAFGTQWAQQYSAPNELAIQINQHGLEPLLFLGEVLKGCEVIKSGVFLSFMRLEAQRLAQAKAANAKA